MKAWEKRQPDNEKEIKCWKVKNWHSQEASHVRHTKGVWERQTWVVTQHSRINTRHETESLPNQVRTSLSLFKRVVVSKKERLKLQSIQVTRETQSIHFLFLCLSPRFQEIWMHKIWGDTRCLTRKAIEVHLEKHVLWEELLRWSIYQFYCLHESYYSLFVRDFLDNDYAEKMSFCIKRSDYKRDTTSRQHELCHWHIPFWIIILNDSLILGIHLSLSSRLETKKAVGPASLLSQRLNQKVNPDSLWECSQDSSWFSWTNKIDHRKPQHMNWCISVCQVSL